MNRKYLYLVSLLVFNCATVFAADIDPVGRIKTVSGSAFVHRGTDKFTVKLGMKIARSDTVYTGKQSSVGIVFDDNSTLALGSDTKFELSRYEFNVLEKKAGFVGRISRGSMVFLSGLIAKMNADATRFETPAAVAGVRGTKLAIKVDGGGENE